MRVQGPGDGRHGQYFTFIEGLPPKEFTAWGLSPHMCWGGGRKGSQGKKASNADTVTEAKGVAKQAQAGGLGWAGGWQPGKSCLGT